MSLQREFFPRNFHRRPVRRVKEKKEKKKKEEPESPRFSERIYQLCRVPPLFTSRTRRQHVRNRTRITPEGLLRRGKASDIHPCARTGTYVHSPHRKRACACKKSRIRGRTNPGIRPRRWRRIYKKSRASRYSKFTHPNDCRRPVQT